MSKTCQKQVKDRGVNVMTMSKYRGYFTEQELNEHLERLNIHKLRPQLRVDIGDVLSIHGENRIVVGYHYDYNFYTKEYYRTVVLDNGHHWAEQTAWCHRVTLNEDIQIVFNF
jgi:hypothetical protein